MEVELIRAIPGGGTLVVFVVVVIIFLRQVQVITTSFQAQIQALTDNILKVSMDTSKALSELASAVRDLQVKVDNSRRT